MHRSHEGRGASFQESAVDRVGGLAELAVAQGLRLLELSLGCRLGHLLHKLLRLGLVQDHLLYLGLAQEHLLLLQVVHLQVVVHLLCHKRGLALLKLRLLGFLVNDEEVALVHFHNLIDE